VTESTYLFKSDGTAGRGRTAAVGLGAPASPGASSGASDAELIAEMTREMLEAADRLEFERAAFLRDQIKKLKAAPPASPSAAGARRKGKRTR